MSSETLPARLFAALADGRCHSGEDLARQLGVSRSAVWKAANILRELDVTLAATRNRGYQLAQATEPLAAEHIRGAIAEGLRSRVERLEVVWCVDSTNAALIARAPPSPGRSEVLLAEFQTAGRGRRGRSWLAPLGGALCLSLSWTFPQVPRDMGSLSLAIGVCVRRALAAQGAQCIELKWPNDLLHDGRKLGGILIELRAEVAGPACAVIGIGLNLALGEKLAEKIAATGLPATDLMSAGLTSGARNAVAAAVIESCLQGLMQFELEGLKPFIEEWQCADALRGRPITVHAADTSEQGLARGIDLAGALLVETPRGLRKFFSGEVTIRAVA